MKLLTFWNDLIFIKVSSVYALVCLSTYLLLDIPFNGENRTFVYLPNFCIQVALFHSLDSSCISGYLDMYIGLEMAVHPKQRCKKSGA